MSIFLLLSLGIAYAFEQRPQNTVVKIGESFELSCQHDFQQIDWYHRRLLTVNETNHEKKVKGSNRIKIYKDSNWTKLVISSVEVNDAGIYTCMVITDRMTTEQAGAVVEVISDPTCEMTSKTTLTETDRIEIRCTFSQYGPAKPLMRWKQVAANGDEKDLNSTNTVTVHAITSKLSALADVKMPRSEFRFEVSFEVDHLKSSQSQSLANNTLDLHLWTSPDIRIIYGPRNLIVHPPEGVLRADEQATCHAEGNPRPIVEWINAKTMRVVVRGPNLTADEISAGRPQSAFTCRATNGETNRTAIATIDFKVVKNMPNATMEDKTEALDWPSTTLEDKVGTEYMLAKVFLPASCLSLAIIGGLMVYIISRKRKKRNKETVRVKAILRGRQIAPTCSASQQVFPQCVTKLQPLDEDNYLSPRPDLTPVTACHDDYEELPDMKSLSVHNIVYFELPSSKSLPLPSTPDAAPSGPRTYNDYMEISECEPNPRGKIYEPLRRK